MHKLRITLVILGAEMFRFCNECVYIFMHIYILVIIKFLEYLLNDLFRFLTNLNILLTVLKMKS